VVVADGVQIPGLPDLSLTVKAKQKTDQMEVTDADENTS
jgi:hypothetical protein